MNFAIICSGQGAQLPDLFQQMPFTEKGNGVRRRVVEAGCLEPEVAAWLAEPGARPEEIFKNHFSQPLLCLFQQMVWAELAGSLPTPQFFAGYSLGEVSAYGCAGALGEEDVVRLAGLRARAMDAAGSGELVAATGLEIPQVEEVAKAAGGFLAIVLAEDHCVVGCRAGGEGEIVKGLLAAGAREAVVLPVSVPSHTPLLEAAVEPFREALHLLRWSPPVSPILAGIDAGKVSTHQQMDATLPEQIHRTVRWDLVRQRLREAECGVVLELGPGCQLAHAFLGEGGRGDARAVGEFRSWEGVAAWVEKTLERLAGG